MGLVRAFAYYGFIQTSLIYVYLIKNAYKNKNSLVQFVLVIFLYVNSLLAQTDMFYPALFILFFINAKDNIIFDGDNKNV